MAIWEIPSDKIILYEPNGGGMAQLPMGAENDKSTKVNSTFDLYLAQDTKRVFIWTGTDWAKFLSLNFDDMLNYEVRH